MKFLKHSEWAENMLVDGSLIVSHWDTTTDGKPDKDCPQGGVLSPRVWFRVVNNLLKDLKKEGFLIYGYTDDTAILVTGNFLNTPEDLMINAMKTVQEQSETKDLTVIWLKTNVIIFTRKYKPQPIVPLRLRGENKLPSPVRWNIQESYWTLKWIGSNTPQTEGRNLLLCVGI